MYAGKKELIGWRAVFNRRKKGVARRFSWFFLRKKALTLWTGVFDSGKNVVHGGEGDFSPRKKTSPCGQVFLTAEKTLCTAVRGNFPQEKSRYSQEELFFSHLKSMYTYVSQLLYGRGMPRPISFSIYFSAKEITSALDCSCCTVAACRDPLVFLSISV